MTRNCETKRQTGKLHVNKPLHSIGRDKKNINEGHEQMQETKRIK